MTQPSNPSTRLSLLVKFKAGDLEAWELFFTRYHPLLLTWCYRRGLSAELAEDVTQELMIELRSKVHKYDLARPFRPWLRTVMNNFIASYRRDESRVRGACGPGGSAWQERLEQLAAPDSIDDVSAELQTKMEQDSEAVLNAVQTRVSEEIWQAFYLTRCENQAAADVAALLGMSRSAVYQAAYRVSRMLPDAYQSLDKLSANVTKE